MTIMAARMHLSVMNGSVLKAVRLMDGQCIHIGSQTNGPFARTDLERADDAGLTYASMDVEAKGLESLCDEV
jgi:hypothetical protein